MELILNILYIYIAAYSLFFLVLSVKNLNDKKFKTEERFVKTAPKNNLCFVVYSHNNCKNLEKLLPLIKNQDYPQENVLTYVILDNCSDMSENLLAGEDRIQTFNIKNVDTIGKDQAISILLEKLLPAKNIDAYVFLDADRFIDSDFLTTVNCALMNSSVISGSTKLVSKKMNLRKKIKSVFHKYYTNFLLRSRSLASLANIIDSDIFVIRKELVEQVGSVDFQNINTELKYSLLLSKIGFKCTFNPNIKTYIDIDDFTLRIPSLTARFSLFKDCITQMRFKEFSFNEQVMSLLYPNVWILILGYAFLLKHSYKYYFFVDFAVVLTTFIGLMLGFSLSLLSSKINSKDALYLFLYPFYSLGHILKHIFCRNSRPKHSPKNSQKLQLNVFVTDGKMNIPCHLVLLSENGLAKVKFTYKKKKFTTGNHLRMVDAIGELTSKLQDYGFVLKICQCCESFTPNVDGTTNMVKGFCHFNFAGAPTSGPYPTLLWNFCEAFQQKKLNSVIEEISNV